MLTHRLSHAMGSEVRFLEWMESLSEAVKLKSKLYWRARIWKMPECGMPAQERKFA